MNDPSVRTFSDPGSVLRLVRRRMRWQEMHSSTFSQYPAQKTSMGTSIISNKRWQIGSLHLHHTHWLHCYIFTLFSGSEKRISFTFIPQVETVVEKWFQNKSGENIVNSFVGNYYDAVKIFRKEFVQNVTSRNEFAPQIRF